MLLRCCYSGVVTQVCTRYVPSHSDSCILFECLSLRSLLEPSGSKYWHLLSKWDHYYRGPNFGTSGPIFGSLAPWTCPWLKGRDVSGAGGGAGLSEMGQNSPKMGQKKPKRAEKGHKSMALTLTLTLTLTHPKRPPNHLPHSTSPNTQLPPWTS